MSDNVDDNYIKLAGLLQGRKDWQPGVQDGERYWYFGVSGAGRLVITPEMEGFLMYRADQDRSGSFPGLRRLRNGSMSMSVSTQA